MNAKIITAIAAAVLIIIFALQNTMEVDLHFFAWEFNGSLSLFLLISIILGMVIGSLFTISLRKEMKKHHESKVEPGSTLESPLGKA
ncbi:MAG TPA: LapA family protein [Bacteroidales bacterium]|nr:LapA family protein [Bacteroidales bacterium]